MNVRKRPKTDFSKNTENRTKKLCMCVTLLIVSMFPELQGIYANSDRDIRVKNLDMATFDMELLLNLTCSKLKQKKLCRFEIFQ